MSPNLMSEGQTVSRKRGWFGPGLLVAATGVGAGDLIAAAVAGRQFGVSVLWVVVVGAVTKWLLNEGIARWQLATGESIIRAWATRLPRWVFWYFGGYLTIWSFLVAGALGSACGVAWKALWPQLPGSVAMWATVHAVVGFGIVWKGDYRFFEKVMQFLVAAMFVFVIACGIQLAPEWRTVVAGLLIPVVPEGGLWVVLGLMGGVGGSATLLCYGYWMREKGWNRVSDHFRMQWDLLIAYGLTAAFGVAMVILAAGAQPENASGTALVLALGDRLGEVLGPTGRLLFLSGFWCAVFTSLLGVWQGVPYLFEDWWCNRRTDGGRETRPSSAHSGAYVGFLAYLALPPLILQLVDRPLLIVVIYAVAGAFFMPLLAGSLLVLNTRGNGVVALRNPRWVNAGLVFSLVLFGALLALEVTQRLFG